MPDVVRSIARGMIDAVNFIAIEAVILIGLGGWLSYQGYLA